MNGQNQVLNAKRFSLLEVRNVIKLKKCICKDADKLEWAGFKVK